MKKFNWQLLTINVLRWSCSITVGIYTASMIFINECFPVFIEFLAFETNFNGLLKFIWSLFVMTTITAYLTSVAWSVAYILFKEQLSFNE